MSDYLNERSERYNCFERNFLFPFYSNANEIPNNLLGFYGAESKIGRENEGEMNHYWASEVPISILNPRPSEQWFFDFEEANPLFTIEDSTDGILLVRVTGCLIFINGERKTFIHNIILGPEELQGKQRYFILNDMFETKPVVFAPTVPISRSSASDGLKPAHMLWDIENCHIPKGYPVDRLWGRIDAVLRSYGYKLDTAVGIGNYECQFKKAKLAKLQKSGFIFKKGGTMEASSRTLTQENQINADFHLATALWKWTYEGNGSLFLVTGDSDFSPLIETVEGLGIEVILGYKPDSTAKLISASAIKIGWEKVFFPS